LSELKTTEDEEDRDAYNNRVIKADSALAARRATRA